VPFACPNETKTTAATIADMVGRGVLMRPPKAACRTGRSDARHMIGPSSSPGIEAGYHGLLVSPVKLHGARRGELKSTARSSWGS
jgi:hypothetical protein